MQFKHCVATECVKKFRHNNYALCDSGMYFREIVNAFFVFFFSFFLLVLHLHNYVCGLNVLPNVLN